MAKVIPKGPTPRITAVTVISNICNIYHEPQNTEDFAEHMGIWLKANGGIKLKVTKKAPGTSPAVTETMDMSGEHIYIHLTRPDGTEMNETIDLGKQGNFANWSYGVPQHSPRAGKWTLEISYRPQNPELVKLLGKVVPMKSETFDIPKYKPFHM